MTEDQARIVELGDHLERVVGLVESQAEMLAKALELIVLLGERVSILERDRGLRPDRGVRS